MRKTVIAIFLYCWLTPTLLVAANQAELEDILSDIEAVRADVQKNAASFLLIAKQMNAGDVAASNTEQFVQITDVTAEVRETDLVTSPLLMEVLEGDEFPLVEQRNEWYRISLKNGREGWIHRENGEIIEREVNEPVSGNALSVDPRIRQMTDHLYERIQNQYHQARELFTEFDEVFGGLSSSEQTEASTVHSAYLNEKEKIETYYEYAAHYHRKLSPMRSPVLAQSGGNQIGYEGTASLRLGTSSYESMEEESTTSRNLNMNGSVIFSPQTRLNVNLNHNNDVIQTPYTSNDVNLNVQHQTNGGTRLQGSVLYNSFSDANFERNNFQNMGFGARVDHPLNPQTRFFGDVQADSKTYDVSGGNEFKGARFNTGLNFNGSKTRANIGVRGRIQDSEISFLDYMRIIPSAGATWLTGNGSFGIRAEAEQLTYAAEAEGNNFNRGRLDLEWAGNVRTTSLILIAKQFPNNEAFDNYRIRLRNQWNKSSGAGLARTAFSVQYVYHPQEETQLTNYVDLRLDRSSSGKKAYFNLNLFGRYWEETGREHTVDLFSRFGFKFSQFQVGPAIGAQLLLNPDDLQIERNGNSFRAGIDGRVNTAIEKATIYGHFRYQKSLVYNSQIDIDTSTGLVTEGDLETRMPTTIQFSAGVQVPLIDALDLKIDASYYNVDLDISEDISINPIQSRKGLRLLAGVSYRFNRQQFKR
ncbi:SH3 domain-containing protein [Rhodohalobacter sp. 614A]|uniref:SH3 domain-containing protein n=1 Tax=Rhodohalobacter sp. 614A TaxID=2908649 RepID=UPI001F215C41|nr:SH3 domain-containing protein [Rhodohalobacter sp. 614A]